MNKEIYTKMSELLLFAVDFQPGDKLGIDIEVDQRVPAINLAELAYRRGAQYVEISYRDGELDAAAIKGSQKDFFFPEYQQELQRETTQPGWKKLALLSEVHADVYKGLDAERSALYLKRRNEKREILRNAIMTNKIPWTATYYPSEPMAMKAFPGLSAGEAVKKYWELIIKIMRLDLDDPVAFWKDKLKKDKKRTNILNSLNADYLHFKGPGTDLKVGIPEKVKWVGGFDETVDGRQFVANIPTDEIFTSPDWKRTEGRVTLTRPFVMHQNLGDVPINAWFEFSSGKVVDFGADKGRESLENFFKIDERAKYIGEIALVDPQSPFAATGITYYNGLYDENAACHLALGKAYPFTLTEQADYNDEELQNLGLNTAIVHEDMMVGGTEVDVTAVGKDGKKTELIKDGEYKI